MKELVYLNGDFLPREEAKISPDDRGFIFADGIYEVIKYYHGVPFCFNDHMERLKYSLSQISLTFKNPHELEGIILKLLETNGLMRDDAGVYIQITRGAAKRVHYFTDSEPTIYIFTFPFQANIKDLMHGINVITDKDIRWHRCDIKSVSLLPNIMLFDKAHKNGAGETIMVRNGIVTEATHSSVIGVMEEKIYTHPLSNHILPSITRKVVLEICKNENIQVVEKAITEEMLNYLDELMITGTGSEITPVVRLNSKPIKNGIPGVITKRLQKLFFEKVYTTLPANKRWW